MRDLAAVIDSMVATIADLLRIKRGICAPETVGTEWRKVQGVLVDRIGAPDCDWKNSVAAIFRGQR